MRPIIVGWRGVRSSNRGSTSSSLCRRKNHNLAKILKRKTSISANTSQTATREKYSPSTVITSAKVQEMVSKKAAALQFIIHCNHTPTNHNSSNSRNSEIDTTSAQKAHKYPTTNQTQRAQQRWKPETIKQSQKRSRDWT